MKPAEKKHIRLRVIIVGAIFSLFFTAIGAKAVYLQIFRGAWLSQKAADQYEVSCKSYGKRGTIYDTNLKELAISIDVTSIAAHPPKIKNARAGYPAAPRITRLPLLPLGSDGVCRIPPRRTHPDTVGSIPQAETIVNIIISLEVLP